MARTIIGLTGKMSCGKSTAAHELHRRGFTRLKFAGPLKQMLTVLGLTEQEIEGSLKEEPCALLCNMTPRFAMQTLGTEWGRDTIGAALWTNAFRFAVNRLPEFIPVVVDDVRFPNEAAVLKSMGGKLIRIVRTDSDNVVKHASELMTFDVDETIQNDGSLHDLRAQVLNAAGLPPAGRVAA